MACSHQAPLSTGFPRSEYWSGLPFPFPGVLRDPGIKPQFPALGGGFFTTESPGSPRISNTIALYLTHLYWLYYIFLWACLLGFLYFFGQKHKSEVALLESLRVPATETMYKKKRFP